MAIFGRFKKSKETTPLQSQSSFDSYQDPYPAAQYTTAPSPNWSHVGQRRDLSQVYHQPQGWLVAPLPAQYQLVVAPPLPQRPETNVGNISRLQLCSVTNLLNSEIQDTGARFIQNEITPFYLQSTQYLHQGTVLRDLIYSKFDEIITLIDGDRFNGDERELTILVPPQHILQQQQETETSERKIEGEKSKGMVNSSAPPALTNSNSLTKVHLYANSRLPPSLPPMKLYITTFPLLSLASRYSERVYVKPTGQEKEAHVDEDRRQGTKAMVIKSVPMDDMNTIVFAIRGTNLTSFADWAVNVKSEPTSPEGFLDDPGNLCHAGFLSVAKKMIKPVAARLRHLLEEDPGRSKCSLLITGHSAGGAVASLLYSHMLSTSREAESELNILTGFFKRVHCITFGAPPVSLLPLATPKNPALKKSLFLSFVNEGDPVARADKAYVWSLISLYTSPAPGKSCLEKLALPNFQPLVSSLGKSTSSLAVNKIRPAPKQSKTTPVPQAAPLWPVPEAKLSNAGRIVLLRSVQKVNGPAGKKKKDVHGLMNDGVVAQMVSDEILRGVVWGDPICHPMKLYARRIEILATNAVMGKF